MEDERDEAGRFRKGVSGNPNGRPLKVEKHHSMPLLNQRSAFDVAEQPVTVTVNGAQKTMTLFEANLYQIGMKGARGELAAAKAFVAMVARDAKDYERSISLVDMFHQENRILRAELDELKTRYPRQNGGVLVLPPKDPVE